MYEPYAVRHSELFARLATFRRFSDYEHRKTVAAAEALANRAVDLYRGAVPEKCGGMPMANADGIFARAERYVEALENDQFPLLGAFAEIGGGMGDHCFIEKDGVMHIFYIRHFIGYSWAERYSDALGHAWSTDLINWNYSQPVVTIAPDGPDTFQVWAPAVIEHNGKYYMYYTGVNDEFAQSICLAISEDLFTWEKYDGNPVVLPGEWSPWREDKWSACRDPMIISDGKGTWYMYYCAQQRTDNGQMYDQPTDGTHPNNCPIFTDIPVKNVVAVASSRDLFNWKDEGFLELPGVVNPPESPYVFRYNDTFFLIAAGNRSIFISEGDLLKGWKPFDNHGVQVVEGCSEIFEYKGIWFLSATNWEAPGELFAQEQYLRIRELFWKEDGTMVTGPYLKAPIQ